MARVVGVPLARNSAAHRRALQLAFERCATPLVMGTAKKLKPPTRVCVALPLGAPTILSCAAAGVSGGLTGAVNAVTTKSKLDKIEARTVTRRVRNRSDRCLRVAPTCLTDRPRRNRSYASCSASLVPGPGRIDGPLHRQAARSRGAVAAARSSPHAGR